MNIDAPEFKDFKNFYVDFLTRSRGFAKNDASDMETLRKQIETLDAESLTALEHIEAYSQWLQTQFPVYLSDATDFWKSYLRLDTSDTPLEAKLLQSFLFWGSVLRNRALSLGCPVLQKSKSEKQTSGLGCLHCGKSAVKRRSLCRTKYCTLECQKIDWTRHKPFCGKKT